MLGFIIFLILKLDIFSDLFGYRYNWWFDFIPKKQRRAYFRILNRDFNDFIPKKQRRLIFRLSCNGLGKINDHKYMLIWLIRQIPKS